MVKYTKEFKITR